MGPLRSTSPAVAYEGFPKFTVFFQPIVDVANRRVPIYEALTRGLDGRAYPDLVAGMSKEMLHGFHRRTAFRAMRLAAKQHLLDLGAVLSINIQPDVTAGAMDAEFLQNAARHHGIPASRIIVELTEDHKLSLKDLRTLVGANQAAGFVTAMDDFGAGYAGLNMLVDCRPEILKMDRGLIRGIATDSTRQKIVGAFFDLSKSLNMTVIAEGVETQDECDTLRELGITLMQGYLFSAPVPRLIPWQLEWGQERRQASPKILQLDRALDRAGQKAPRSPSVAMQA
ncbi:EAL domain, c-di-GMP-specific phosphodiesterase class I (or its enzymatically inactive variant) [Granulicella rosea]|uniref:EAL domain, c-di-GMP-specific phosphodiesterase class I (Or its enzymatically inactive variant) n=1 Tax=Granulicella rosea TaxID=474952 RepID=A0A239LX05_9BACT|nr:EAL domain-containing protein [Granulicella rosea]SNT34991.1 EAL domain, c-di-GMP-specific phosphodiesterase class I (or its enzymatically inactive variant) [Granulicella rosea]